MVCTTSVNESQCITRMSPMCGRGRCPLPPPAPAMLHEQPEPKHSIYNQSKSNNTQQDYDLFHVLAFDINASETIHVPQQNQYTPLYKSSLTQSYRGRWTRKPFSNVQSCTGVSFEPLLLLHFRACLAGHRRKICTGVSSERCRPRLRSSPRRENMNRHNVYAISVLPLNHLKETAENLEIVVFAWPLKF